MDSHATIWQHLAEFRKTLIQLAIVIGLGFCISFYFSDKIIDFFKLPLESSLVYKEIKHERIENKGKNQQQVHLSHNIKILNVPESIDQNTYILQPGESLEIERPVDRNELVMLSPFEGMLTSFKVSFWVGLVITSPIWLYFLSRFVIPALNSRERQVLGPLIALSIIFLLTGFCFAFFITLPLANQYLLSFNQTVGINLWSLSNYLDYTLLLVLANGLAFELTLVLFLLVHFKIINVETMVNKRRHMIVLAFILGAILTPPDVLTQFLLAIPLIGLYETAILYARLRSKMKSPGLRSRQIDSAINDTL